MRDKVASDIIISLIAAALGMHYSLFFKIHILELLFFFILIFLHNEKMKCLVKASIGVFLQTSRLVAMADWYEM